MRPEARLGLRVEGVRRQVPVWPVLVIAESPSDYARLLTLWSPRARFPVLIDDGSVRAQEDIARFVRDFEPERVLRFAPEPGGINAAPLPEDPGRLVNALESVANAAWGARDQQSLVRGWQEIGFTPRGVVVASPNDPAWTAAIALAAGHGQPIIWINREASDVDRVASAEDVRMVTESVQESLELVTQQWKWNDLGDDIDAITLCLSIGSRFDRDGQMMALTDRVGRFSNDKRFAWAGMIFGDASRAAYQAMCSLFLQPTSAWVFDGYEASKAPPYALQRAGEVFEEVSLSVSSNLPPRGGIDDWRRRTEFGVGADVIFVNTQGFTDWFGLSPGRGRTGDVPFLHRPALVHFTHSFSAQRIGDPSTIGGRWLAQGAYVYYGSMDEPTLGGFAPGAQVAARLYSGWALGGAVRHPEGKLWKINLFGDPLHTFGPPARRIEDALEVPETIDIEDDMKAALTARDIGAGVRALVLLGRDSDAVRLCVSARDTSEDGLNPEIARAGIFAALRERDALLVADLFGALSARERRESPFIDALWHAAHESLRTGSPDAGLVGVLGSHIRAGMAVEDAAMVAPALARVRGDEAVRSMYARLIDRARDERDRKALSEALREW